MAIFSTNAEQDHPAEQPVLRQRRQRRARRPASVNTVLNGFSSAALGTTAAAAVDDLGNFVGNPAFVFPIDPRPGSDGPANFFLDADFQLTAASAAIDNAWEATAIPTDLLGNSQVKIAGGGFGLPGYGPRDIGAFEFDGTGGIPLGGAFRVVSTSLVPIDGRVQGERPDRQRDRRPDRDHRHVLGQRQPGRHQRDRPGPLGNGLELARLRHTPPA